MTGANRGTDFRPRSASVLVGMLWCVALLSIVVIGVLHTARVDLTVVKNYGDREQARYLALAGIERAKALLYQDLLDRKAAAQNHTGLLYDSPDQFQDLELGRGTLSVFHGDAEGMGDAVYGVTDEEARLNLNKATPEELGKLYGVTPDIVGAITDWKDEDDNVSAGGAEAEYYLGLNPPYVPRNGPFQTTRELLMVRGVSRDLMFADDMKQNGLLPRAENQSSDARGRRGKNAAGPREGGLAVNLSVDGWTENVNAAGDARVNIQTADQKALSGISGISKELAQAILTYRNNHKFDSIVDLLDVTAPPRNGRNSRGNANDSSGPRLISEDLFLEIADSVTTQNNRELAGLVNINTASAQVLACLPGLTAESAQAIVSYRASNGFFPNIACLLKVPGLSREILKQLANRVTTRSETFRIISEGRIKSSGARQGMQMIVHVGANEVRTLSYREDL